MANKPRKNSRPSKSRPSADQKPNNQKSDNRRPDGQKSNNLKSDNRRPNNPKSDHRRPGSQKPRPASGHRPYPHKDFKDHKAAPASPANVSPELVASSKKTIQGWLDEGKDLRESQLQKQPIFAVKDFPLDAWQQDVFDLLTAGESVIVDAPTTAGKTRAVEVFFARNIDSPGFRAAYTTPVKSLSNDKLRELRAMFGADKVGISTGDIKENLDAPIVVATLESYRNSLLGTEPDFGRTLVVFDEYHYLQDEGRGSAWEEALILTPPACQVLLLSASVSNADQFAEWVNSLSKRRASLVQTLHRPVPLTNIIYHGGAWLTEKHLPDDALKKQNPRLQERPLSQDELAGQLPLLLDLQLTPCIIYCGKRLDTENLAHLIEKRLAPLPAEDAMRIGDILQKVHAEVGALSFIKPALRRMIQTYGVAYHHSGLAPAARIAIERLVKDGLIRYCVATMGLSLGINFSVRSALIADYQRPSEKGPTDYAQGEVLQMLGRAGRRGKDIIGFSLWPNIESYTRMAASKREPCNSRLRTDPTTLLGLIGRHLSLGTIESIYNKSFMKFQRRNMEFRLIRRAEVENKLGTTDLPCSSPSHTYANFDPKNPNPDSLCLSCPLKEPCHNYQNFRKSSRLASMHLHLHKVGCISPDEKLTELGDIARFFPQNGGLVVSKMIVDKRLRSDKLMAACELFAALCLPRFKEIYSEPTYRFPFDRSQLEKELEEVYPISLFPELYDAPYGKRTWYQIKEYNPEAGWIVRQWLSQSMDWQTLVKNGTTQYFGVGDLMGLMYRLGTYLQSLAGCNHSEFSREARTLRSVLLRAPLDLTL